MNPNQFIQQYRARFEGFLQERFTRNEVQNSQLQQAMAYSLLDGGKRIRALLVYASALAIGKIDDLTDAAAALDTLPP